MQKTRIEGMRWGCHGSTCSNIKSKFTKALRTSCFLNCLEMHSSGKVSKLTKNALLQATKLSSFQAFGIRAFGRRFAGVCAVQ